MPQNITHVRVLNVGANRLKVTQASAYYISRTAISCSYFREVYGKLEYGGESMLHWCKWEVRWGADWLLKTHVRSKDSKGPNTWTIGPNGDKFVVMVRSESNPCWCVRVSPGFHANNKALLEQVGAVPGDWACYRRAETIPVAPNCTEATRETLLADSSTGAADSAGETATALAATAVLFQDEDFSYALKCLATAHALMDFATLHQLSAVLQNSFFSASESAGSAVWLLCTWSSFCQDVAFGVSVLSAFIPVNGVCLAHAMHQSMMQS